jgi:hypothetical protein
MTEADLQHLKAFFERIAEESRASKARSRQAWSSAKRIALIFLLAASLASYYLLVQLHAALAA